MLPFRQAMLLVLMLASAAVAAPVVTIDSVSTATDQPLTQPVPTLHCKAGDPWTINCFIKADQDPEDKVIIAGFGTCKDGTSGLGRYLCIFPDGLHYWSCNEDISSEESLDVGNWQMMTAASDGRQVTLYADGRKIGQEKLSLADDRDATVRVAPVDPWSKKYRVHGEIRNLAIWNSSLMAPNIQMLWADWARTHPPTTRPAAGNGEVRINVDASQAPDLAGWANNTLVPVLKKWYPLISAQLVVPGHQPPDHFSIIFDKSYKGVAATSGTNIVADPEWFRSQLHKEAVGAMIHEEVHVVQLPRRWVGHHMPNWLLEGTADYIRWFQYEPASARPKSSADKAKYDASYRTTAIFLDWIVSHRDKNLIAEMNQANYQGTYSDDLWVKFTGKTAADLGAEWATTLKRPATQPK